jgi:hypothetical protein
VTFLFTLVNMYLLTAINKKMLLNCNLCMQGGDKCNVISTYVIDKLIMGWISGRLLLKSLNCPHPAKNFKQGKTFDNSKFNFGSIM